MEWVFPNNRTSYGQKIVIIADTATNDETNRENNAVRLAIGHEDDMLEDCKRITLTKKEWIELKQKINNIF